MKNLSFIPFLFSILTLTAQQSSVSGIVSIHNSQFETGKRLFVPNAEIKDAFDKANPTTTDATPLYQEAFRAFQAGDFEKALDILRGANLEKQSKDILAEKKRNDAARVS